MDGTVLKFCVAELQIWVPNLCFIAYVECVVQPNTSIPSDQCSGTLRKWPGRGADQSPPSCVEVNNGGAIPLHPLYLHSIMLISLSTGTTLPLRKHFYCMVKNNSSITYTLYPWLSSFSSRVVFECREEKVLPGRLMQGVSSGCFCTIYFS
jgi:hypothetical protein